MVQMGKQALTPPGDAKPDLWIIRVSQSSWLRLGLQDDHSQHVTAVYENAPPLRAAISGITGSAWA
jgi:formate dehydrogenase major subunit